jgi:enoyl-CoA hydratase
MASVHRVSGLKAKKEAEARVSPAPAQASSALQRPRGKTMDFETLTVTLDGPVATVRLNRPEKANAMNLAMWHEIRRAFEWVDATPAARVAVLEGEGRHFTAGIDLQMMAGLAPTVHDDCDGRAREKLRRLILDLQDTLTSLERCRKPVLAAIHGGCVGGGVDLVCCADIRYASADAHFTVKEIDLGMVADVGTLQRLPKIVGAQGWVREVVYTGRAVDAAEAHAVGMVTRVFDDRAALTAGVHERARAIAAKSPLAMRGLKEMLNYARDHSVADGLNHVATWNAAMLLSDDLMAATSAGLQKKAPVFRD